MEQRPGQEGPAALGGEPHGAAARGGAEVRGGVPQRPGVPSRERGPRVLEPLRLGHHRQPGLEEQRDLGDPEPRPGSDPPANGGRHGGGARDPEQDHPGPGSQQTLLHADRRQQTNWNQLKLNVGTFMQIILDFLSAKQIKKNFLK